MGLPLNFIGGLQPAPPVDDEQTDQGACRDKHEKQHRENTQEWGSTSMTSHGDSKGDGDPSPRSKRKGDGARGAVFVSH